MADLQKKVTPEEVTKIPQINMDSTHRKDSAKNPNTQVNPIPCLNCIHFIRCGYPLWTYCKAYGTWNKGGVSDGQ